MRTPLPLLLKLCLLLLCGAPSAHCAHPASSKIAKPLQAVPEPGVDLKSYKIATVLPFAVATTNVPSWMGPQLAEDIRDRLNYDFGTNLFKEVREAPPLGTTEEILVTGTIAICDPGKSWEFYTFGTTKRLTGELILRDASSQKLLLKASFDNVVYEGGGLFSGRGLLFDTVQVKKKLTHMLTEVAASSANTIAQKRGWKYKK